MASHDYEPGPTEISDPRLRFEVQRAGIWIGMVLLAALVVVLAAPLLLIIGGMVFAVLLDGGTRLLGRWLPIGRGWRLALVILAALLFIGWTIWYSGTQLVNQFALLRDTVTAQADRLLDWLSANGLFPDANLSAISGQLFASIGRVTSVLGTAIGALTAAILIFVIGIFIAIEPKIYDRGVAWMVPMAHREKFFEISDRVGFALRRLLAGRILGMVIEGIFTYVMLAHVGTWFGIAPVPLAAVLGLLTGLLAFIPNIGAIISGILMVAVGFSAGTEPGLWAIFVYFFVQNFDGYVIIPLIAKKTVDLAPALVLAAQLLMGTLFGFLGLLLADPIVAAIKTTLEEISKRKEEAEPAPPPPED
ncbi:AI-2E family transporter [Sphingomicrobium lutaoense]|uniref:Putative PurR-regulated permease PerM n=1 Tax=Sphingomicrobium lutaoense TaxID=515949 RepID=A0A839Z365_9SPHN|nr:AI-2E family transporter [Sphingomicrobium lutaoense]MBB3764988.1 putative PurR-regulated permease PerM [Sphingomicrobium lutaoense]